MEEEILILKKDLLKLVSTKKSYINNDIKKIILQDYSNQSYEEKLNTLISKFREIAELDAVKSYVEAYITIPQKEEEKKK